MVTWNCQYSVKQRRAMSKPAYPTSFDIDDPPKKSKKKKGKLSGVEKLKCLFGYRCLACGVRERTGGSAVITQDHIVPLSRGGVNALWNIQPLCLKCNGEKKTEIFDYRDTKIAREELAQSASNPVLDKVRLEALNLWPLNALMASIMNKEQVQKNREAKTKS
jgi:hypothetical protein